MTIEQKINAICLNAIDYKENDKIIYLLTEQGKMSAIVKGVKKPKAKLKALCQPFCYGEYLLVIKGEMAVVSNATVIDANFSLLSDFEIYEMAKVGLQIGYKLAYQIQNDKALYDLTLNFFYDLKQNKNKDELLHIFNMYLYNILAISGYGIDNFCSKCGVLIQKDVYFNEFDGNFYCEECNNNCELISKNIFTYLQNGIYDETIDRNIMFQANLLLKKCINIHLGYKI